MIKVRGAAFQLHEAAGIARQGEAQLQARKEEVLDAVPFPIRVLGVSTDDEFEDLLDRLRIAIAKKYALSESDWARVQFLAEMCWVSDIIGSGVDFQYSYRDELAIPWMRSIQRKFRRYALGGTLFPGNGGHISYPQNQASERATEPELIAIDLSDDERQFIQTALAELGGTVGDKLFPVEVFGVATVDEFKEMLTRLRIAIASRGSLSRLEWTRAQLLTEICWGSDIIGSGIDFQRSYPDELAAPLMRLI
jgi:hypothetical protein